MLQNQPLELKSFTINNNNTKFHLNKLQLILRFALLSLSLCCCVCANTFRERNYVRFLLSCFYSFSLSLFGVLTDLLRCSKDVDFFFFAACTLIKHQTLNLQATTTTWLFRSHRAFFIIVSFYFHNTHTTHKRVYSLSMKASCVHVHNNQCVQINSLCLCVAVFECTLKHKHKHTGVSKNSTLCCCCCLASFLLAARWRHCRRVSGAHVARCPLTSAI